MFQPASLVYGQQATGKEFRNADVNKDGKVDAAELTIIIIDITPAKFKEYDKNGDGILDDKEFVAAGTGKTFKDVDYNKDGKIDISEFTVIMISASPEWFKKFDRNGSGFLDEAEYNALMQKK
jgi:Ca2+-binding EF-hand superfamily protein